MRPLRFCLLIFVITSCAHIDSRRPAALDRPGRIYKISGNSASFGAYTGVLQILHQDTEQSALVTRIVDYTDFRFEGKKVEEVWQGQGIWKEELLRVSFSLRQADVFNSVDGNVRTPEQYLQPKVVNYQADLEGAARFGEQSESLLNGEDIPATEDPLWKNERKYLVSQGNSNPILGEIATYTVFLPAQMEYKKDPFVQKYVNRPEFKSGNQYFIFDPTDFSFLRQHPDTIRVPNKVVDPISLVEAAMRRDAYAPTLDQKAADFDRDFAENHLDNLGLYADAVFDSSGKKIKSRPNGDGCLWTGMYAGSQAMRWLVTKEPKALENFRRSMSGLMLLMDVTGDDATFARTAVPADSETFGFEWKSGAAPHTDLKYLEGGNNDMVKGLFYAFAWANEVLPAGDPLLGEVARHEVRLPKLKEAQELTKHFGNRFMATGLAAIASGDSPDYRKFLAAFAFALKPTNDLSLNQGFYYGGYADWSGVNLGMVSQVAEILIAKQASKKFFGDNPSAARTYVLRQVRQNFLNTGGVYVGAHRGFLTIAVHAFALGNALGFPAASDATSFPQAESWAGELDQAVWQLREVPDIQQAHSISFDFTLKPEWSLSAWTMRPWKYWNEGGPTSRFYQGAYQFPIFESNATTTENYWKDAFEYRGSSSADGRTGRMDYLTTYWMGRLSGLLQTGS